MSRAIDEKVVELKFDNKQFEDGVKESLGTLDKLKQAVDKNISSKSFENVAKAANDIDLQSLTKNVETLSNRFSTFGIIGMRVIQNITDAVMGSLGNAIKTTTDSIVSGGIKRAMNIENAHFQLQGLISDETEVQAIMADAMESVDGTAYAYDEAAKAASMFAATGLRSGEQMQNSLKAIAGVAATTNSDYASLAQIFTTVAGQGKVMAMQLNQLANRGMNAAAAITQYMNGVNDGTIEATESVKSYIKEITNGTQITEADLRDMVSKGKISFELFSEAMATTFGDHAKDANQTFTGAMSNIRAALARTGAMFVTPLIEQNGPLVQFFNTIREKVNDFNKALGATEGIAEKTTSFINRIVEKINEFVKGIKVANYYTADYGDGVKKTFASAHEAMEDLGDGTQQLITGDFYTPFSALSDIFYSVVNILKGLLSILQPIGRAFRNTFDIDSTGIYKAIEGFRILTEHMSLNQKHQEQLQKLFTGIFRVAGALLNIFIRLGNSIKKTNKPTIKLSDGFFNLVEAIGDILVAFADFIDQNKIVNKAIELLGSTIGFIVNIIRGSVGAIAGIFRSYNFSGAISAINSKLLDLKMLIKEAIPEWFMGYLLRIKEIFEKIIKDINIFDLSALKSDLFSLTNVFKDFTKLEEVKGKIVKFFDFKDEESGINQLIDRGNDLVQWIGDILGPAFDNLNVPGTIATGSFLWILWQVGSVFKSLADVMQSGGKILAGVPKILTSLKKAIDSYTIGNTASSAKKFAEAVAILSGSLFFLALIKPERLWPAVAVLGVITAALAAVAFLLKAKQAKPSSAQNIFQVLDTLAKGVSKSLNNLTKAKLVNAWSDAVLKIVIAVGLVLAEVAGLIYLFQKYPTNVGPAIAIVAVIVASLVGIAVGLTMMATKLKKEMNTFAKFSTGILMLSAAMMIVIHAIKELMAIDIPADYQTKLNVLAQVLTMMTLVVISFGFANKIAKDKNNLALSIIGVIGLLRITIWAIKQLLDLDIPADYQTKFDILIGMFSLVGLLVITVGAAIRLAKDGGKGIFGTFIGVSLLISASVHALKEIMSMEFTKDWLKRLAVLAGIFEGVALLVLATSLALNVSKDGGKMAFATFLGVSALIVASVFALKQIMSMKFAKDWVKRLAVLAGIFGTIAVITKIVSSLSNKGLGAFGAFLGIAIMIGVILAALKILEYYDMTKLRGGVIALATILFALSYTLKGAGSISGPGSSLAILSMAIVISSIITALLALSIMSKDSLIKGTITLCVILIILAVSFSGISKISEGSKWKPIIAMTGMIAAITASLAILGFVKWDALLTGALALSGVLLALTKAFEAINGSGTKSKKMLKSAGVFLLLGLALVEIAAALLLVAQQPWPNILASGAAISGVLYLYSKAFSGLDNAKVSIKQIGNFLLGCLSTVVIAAALRLVATQPWQNILAASGAIAAVILAMAVMFGVINSAPKISGEAIAQMLLGSIGVLLIGGALAIAATQPWQNILAAGASISTVLLAMAGAFGIINVTANALSVAAIAEFAVGVVGVLAIAYGLSQLASSANWQELLAAGVSIAVVMVAMAVVMGICSLVGAATPAALAGIVIFDAFIADLAWVLSKLGSLTQDNKDLIANGGDVLVQIGEAIGNFAKAIIEGIGEGIGSALESVGTSLSNFMNNAQGFFNGLDNISDDSLVKAKTMASVILTIASAELVNSIADFISIFTGSSDLKSDLEELGKAIVGFDNATKDITDTKHFQAVAEGAGYLIDMSKKLPNSGGLLGKVLGDNDMDTWGNQLVTMGEKLADFSSKIDGLTDDKLDRFKTYATAVNPLIDMSKELPNSGGLLGDVMGNNDMDTWGAQLVVMGEKMSEFSGKIESLTDDKLARFKTYTTAVKPLIDMSKELPNSGGGLGLIMGNNDMNTWGEQLAAMGEKVSVFAENISGIEPAQYATFGQFRNGVMKLVELSTEMANTDGYGKISKRDATIFGNTIEILGKAVAQFGTDTISLDSAHVTDVSNALKTLVKAVKTVGEFSGASGVSEFTRALTNLSSTAIDSFVNNFSSKASSATLAVTTFIDGVLSTLNTNAEAFTTVGQTQFTNYISGLKNASNIALVKTASQEIAKAAKDGINTIEKEFITIGQNHITAYNNGLGNAVKLNSAKQAGKRIATTAASGAKDSASEFESAGKSAIQGFINGLSNSVLMERVRQSARAMARAASDAAHAELQVNSPSKVFKRLGSSTGEGFVLGIESWYNRTMDAGSKLAKSASSELDTIIESINDSVSTIDDLYPVITPIVDLSNVTGAASSVNDMFNSALLATSTRASSASAIVRSGTVMNSAEEIQNEKDSTGNTYNFIQNNNSPKSLSRIDIYRQTRNQFAQFREAVESV